MAGKMGANVLTNLLVMKPEDLAKNVSTTARSTRRRATPAKGT